MVDHPDDVGRGAVSAVEFIHAEGGGADEVGPPTVVLVGRNAIIFPFTEGGSA